MNGTSQPEARSGWLVLAVVLVGAFMAILDVAIVNVAIPSIRSDLHASFGASSSWSRRTCSPTRACS